MWDKIYCLFISFSLISPSVSSPSHPNPLLSSPLSLTHADAHADDHFHANVNADLSLAMVFLFFFFFFFCCGLMGSVPMEVGGFRWARLWVDDVDVGPLCGSAMTMTAIKIVGLEFGL